MKAVLIIVDFNSGKLLYEFTESITDARNLHRAIQSDWEHCQFDIWGDKEAREADGQYVSNLYDGDGKQ